MPAKRPAWVDIATFTFPSGRHADEVVVNNTAQLVYVINLGCIDLNQWYARCDDVDRPDYLHFDLERTRAEYLKAHPRGASL